MVIVPLFSMMPPYKRTAARPTPPILVAAVVAVTLNVPPDSIVTLPCRPVVPLMLSLRQLAAAVTRTFAPSIIVTLSLRVGTAPVFQLAASVHAFVAAFASHVICEKAVCVRHRLMPKMKAKRLVFLVACKVKFIF